MQPSDQWAAAMRTLDLDRAWSISDREMERRLSSGYRKHTGPRHLQQIWHGEPLTGARVLVRCYHGLGDTIQFIRFVKPLRRIARTVTVWCQRELQALVRQVPGIDVLPLHDGTVDAEFDVDIEVMELPHALRADAALLGGAPYLRAVPETDLERPAGLRIGLVWQAGEWDTARSIPEAHLEELFSLTNCVFYSLRPGAILNGFSVVDCSSPDIETLAARLVSLDLMLTVDTMTAHLAGALGVRTWTLLHSHPDWRWGMNARCAWYPTMRLFRQPRPGDWRPPISDVVAALREPWFADEHRNVIGH